MPNSNLRRQHLGHILQALVEYHERGGELRLHSEDMAQGAIKVTIDVDDSAFLNAQVTEMIAREPLARGRSA